MRTSVRLLLWLLLSISLGWWFVPFGLIAFGLGIGDVRRHRRPTPSEPESTEPKPKLPRYRMTGTETFWTWWFTLCLAGLAYFGTKPHSIALAIVAGVVAMLAQAGFYQWRGERRIRKRFLAWKEAEDYRLMQTEEATQRGVERALERAGRPTLADEVERYRQREN
jgi:hypothetical protein